MCMLTLAWHDVGQDCDCVVRGKTEEELVRFDVDLLLEETKLYSKKI